MEEETIEKLIEKAKGFSQNAYCPYSQIPVGACVLTTNGLIYGGCNIENVSFECCQGAVEVAVLKAVSEGNSNIKAVVVYSESLAQFPSGKERQIIKEFSDKAIVICANDDGFSQYAINELLPFAKEKNEVL